MSLRLRLLKNTSSLAMTRRGGPDINRFLRLLGSFLCERCGLWFAFLGGFLFLNRLRLCARIEGCPTNKP